MTQQTYLIGRLRRQSAELADTGRTLDYSAGMAAANALEATAKNAFEAMPHDIPRRMKDAICEETGWSGSMVSRMYTELRKAFTGEPYKANEDLDAALLEIERLRKDAALVAARERERMEKDAGRYQFLRDCDLDDMAAKYWPGGQVPTGEEFDAAIDAAIRALNTEGDGHDRP